MEGMSDTLDEEISPFGLRSICFDSGCFRTPVLGKVRYKPGAIEDYREAGEVTNAALLGTYFVNHRMVVQRLTLYHTAYNGAQKGDPIRGVNTIIDVIKREGVAQGKDIPSGFSLGADCYETVKNHCEDTLQRLEAWKEVTLSTEYPD